MNLKPRFPFPKKERMGINNLSKFLKTNFPQLFRKIHISEYALKRVAIDTSLYLHKYKKSMGEQGWLQAFVRLVSELRKNDIHCVFIYDTKSPPEKEAERKKRTESRVKIDDKVYELDSAVEKYHQTGEIDDILLEFQKKCKISTGLLRPDLHTVNIKAIEYHLERKRRQALSATKADFEATKKLFDLLDVPYYDAPWEAETMCSDLCVNGKVDAVLSEDTDVLAYSSPVLLNDIEPSKGHCVEIKHTELLEAMELTQEQFLDFCIMCGTDYNDNIFRVGPSKAYKFIKDYGSIENIAKKTVLDISILNHIRVREIFTEYEKYTNDYGEEIEEVPYCGVPDFRKLQTFMISNGIKLSADVLRKSFIREITIEEEDD